MIITQGLLKKSLAFVLLGFLLVAFLSIVTNFSPSSAAVDDAYSKALLHFNGSDGSISFIDESGKIWTAHGDAQIDISQSKFGSYSGQFDGLGDYIDTPYSSDFTVGSGDFTIDFWARLSTVTPNLQYFYGKVGIYSYATLDYLATVFNYSGGDVVLLSSTAVFTPNNWYHIAIVRNGNTFTQYVNGNAQGSGDVTGRTALDTVETLPIGDISLHTGYSFNGWIDEFRFSKGIARWISTFEPPVNEYFGPSPTPTETPIPSSTLTPSPTETPVTTLTPTLTPTETPIPSLTLTLTPTETPIPSLTVTVTPTETPIPSLTVTVTPTETPIPSLTPTLIPTDRPSPTPTETPVPSTTETPLPTSTLTPTNTITPTDNTPLPTPTITVTLSVVLTISPTPQISILPATTIISDEVDRIVIGICFILMGFMLYRSGAYLVIGNGFWFHGGKLLWETSNNTLNRFYIFIAQILHSFLNMFNIFKRVFVKVISWLKEYIRTKLSYIGLNKKDKFEKTLLKDKKDE